MNNKALELSAETTMTSLEIAELMGKLHKNVIRGINNILDSLGSDVSLDYKSTT